MTVCSGTLERVELALIEGVELSSAVQAHLNTCSSCAAEAETLTGIVAALQARPAPVVPAGLAARIVPLMLAEAEKVRRQGVITRAFRAIPQYSAASFLITFALLIGVVGAVAGYKFVAADRRVDSATEAPATEAPATVEPPSTEAPATPALEVSPETDLPALPVAPATEEPTPTPTPELPRRTPEPVSPQPSEGESTAPAESTSP